MRVRERIVTTLRVRFVEVPKEIRESESSQLNRATSTRRAPKEMGEEVSEPIHIISLGAGVQSSTMALMAAAGEITPMPTAAIFADTKGEPKEVYDWLDYLEAKLPFPVYRVTRGSLEEASLQIRNHSDGVKKWTKSLIPAFIQNGDGSVGFLGRACTADYKVKMIIKKARDLAQIKKGEKSVKVIQWIGISIDEIYRMKESRDKWIKHRWPLTELRVNRADCLNWMSSNAFPIPPRSACRYCPFHNDHEWRRLKGNQPEEFEKAVQFEKNLQAVKRVTDNMNGIPFLHRSMKPLDQVDFSTEEERGQLNMFNNECEGMCGV